MGTRSTYRIMEKGVYEGKPWVKKLVLVYVQMDGYPEGHPLETAEWLSSGTVVNGIGMNETRLVFNGASCLAAQFIARKKNGPGGTYIEPLPHRGKCGENYLYDIIVEDGKITMSAYENNRRPKKIFEGSPSEFMVKYSETVDA